jgi:uncharacterized protein (TIGR02145 family)
MKKSITILGAIIVVSLINAGCGSEPTNKDANEKDSTSIVTDSIKIVPEKITEKVIIKMYTSNLPSVDKNDDSFIDKRDGKKYKTKKIGSQIWMTENLAYKPSSGKYFVYNNDKDNVTKYGYLYDWATACKVCPSGWRLPSNADYLEMTDFLGQDFKQKMMMKSAWSSDENASNLSGFGGLPAGMRDHTGAFRYLGTGGYFWTSSFSHQTFAFAREIGKNAGNWASYEFGTNQDIGMSVRCLKDQESTGEIFEQKCESKLLFFEKSGVVKVIGHNCENEYGIFDYYDGTISALKMEGKASYFDNCGGSGEGPTMCMQNNKFAMQFTSDSTILKIDKLNYSMSKVKFSFKTNGLKIYESPSFASKIIEEIKIKNASIELLEIGNLEKKGGEWDVWYKVKSKTNEGWCFGNLIF